MKRNIFIPAVLILLFLSFVIPASAIPPVPYRIMSSVLEYDSAGNLFTSTALLDQAQKSKSDAIVIQYDDIYTNNDVKLMKAGGKQVHILWLPERNRQATVHYDLSNPAIVDTKLAELQYLVDVKFPDADGISLEEPQITAGNAPAKTDTDRKTALTNFFIRAGDIVHAKGMLFSANSPTMNEPYLSGNGWDRKAIDDNRIFDFVALQTDFSTDTVKSTISEWKSAMPNTIIIPVAYSWTANTRGSYACIAYMDTHNGLAQSPSCWIPNQLDIVAYFNTNGMPVYLAQLQWTNPVGAGTIYGISDAGYGVGTDHTLLGVIAKIPVPSLNSTPQQPTPTPTPTPKIIVTPTINPPMGIGSGSMSVSSNPPGASIIINNQNVGVTNKTGANVITQPAVPFYVMIMKEGYKTINDVGIILPGKTLQKTYTLQPVNQKNWFKAWVDSILGIK